MNELAKTIAVLLEQYGGVFVGLSIALVVLFIVKFIVVLAFMTKQFKDMDDDFKHFKRW